MAAVLGILGSWGSDSHAGTTCLATALLCSGVEAERPTAPSPEPIRGPSGPALELVNQSLHSNKISKGSASTLIAE